MLNYKCYFVLFQSALFFLIFSCSKPPKEATVDKIQVRNGLYYAINEEKPFTGNIVDFYKNGQKKIQIQVKNGVPEGNVINWLDNGFKETESIVRGFNTKIEGSKFDTRHLQYLILHGAYIRYYKENGQEETKGYFLDGKPNGLWSRFYSGGKKESDGNYKNGEANGKNIAWYENGQKKYECSWKDGKKDGTETEWDENGIKTTECNFRDGNKHGKFIIFYKDGKKQLENNYVDGILADVIVNDAEIFKTYHLETDDAAQLLNKKISDDWRLDTYRDNRISSQTWNYFKGGLTFHDFGDFNADGKMDVAIGARNKKNSNESRIFVLWGPLYNNYAEIGWSKPFNIVKAGKISGWDNTTLTMKGDGIQMVQVEVSAWIMYWDGNEFKRFQTSD